MQTFRFIRDLFGQWVALMAGLASVGVGVFLQLTEQPALEPKWFWGIAAICVLVAFYRVWAKQNRELIDLRANLAPRIRVRTEPRFKSQDLPFQIDRRFRIGVENLSGSAIRRVRLLLDGCSYPDKKGFHVGQAFTVTGEGTGEITLAPYGIAWFDVIADVTPSNSASDVLELCYASGVIDRHVDRGLSWRCTLRAESDDSPPVSEAFYVQPDGERIRMTHSTP